MDFIIDFYVTTKPKEAPGHDRAESFTMTVPASSYSEAQEKAFTKIKQANTCEDLMNKLNEELFKKLPKGK